MKRPYVKYMGGSINKVKNKKSKLLDSKNGDFEFHDMSSYW